MSAIGDALKGVRELLLLQSQVQRLERAVEGQTSEIRRLAGDLIQIDRRVVRIETLVEVASAGRRQPRIGK